MKLNHLQVEQENILGEIVVVRPTFSETARPLDLGG
jgi:hypothetical protein